MSNGDPQKPNYNRLMFDTVSQSPLRGGVSGPISTQQELTDPIDLGIASFQNRDVRRGELQGGWQQLGNALVQAGAEVVGGTIEGIGYLGDVQSYGDLVKGTEDEFGNMLSEFGKSIKEGSREHFPIYTSFKPGTFSPGNWSWWMSNAPSIASTLSLMIPSGMAVGALSKVANASKAFAKLPKAAQLAGKGTTQAVFSRHMENMMESSQVFDERFKVNIENGMEEGDARKNASIAASSVYNRNWVMLAQDIPQYMFLAGGLKGMKAASNATANAAVKSGKSLNALRGKQALKGLGNMAGEGVEEAYQFGVQKEGEYLSQMALDPNIESNFSDRMREYLKDGDMYSAAFFGALGAGVMQVAGKGINNWLTGGRDAKEQVKASGAQMSQHLKTSMAATETGNENLMQSVVDIGLADVLTSSAHRGQLGAFKTVLESAETDPAKLAEFGFDEEGARGLVENKDEILADIDRFEKIYDDNIEALNKNKWKSKEHAAMASRTEFLLEKLDGRRRESDQRLSDLQGKIVNYDRVSPTGQEILQLQAQNKELRKSIKHTQRLAEDTNLDEGSQQAYIDKVSREKELVEENVKLIAAKKEERTPSEEESDKKKRVSSKALGEVGKEALHNIQIQQTIESLQDTYEKLEKGEMPFKQEEQPTEDLPDSVDPEPTKSVPNVKDIVSHTDPNTGNETTARVTNIENESDYTIQPVNSELADVGKPIKVSVENLEQVIDSTAQDLGHEPISEEDIPEDSEDSKDLIKAEKNANKGLAHMGRSIAWVSKGKKRKAEIRNQKFNAAISDPTLSQEAKDNAQVTFRLDMDNEWWNKHEALKEEILAGPLNTTRINQILNTKSTKTFKATVDQIPVRLTVELEGVKHTTGMFVHRSDFFNIKIPSTLKTQKEIAKYKIDQRMDARQIRRDILDLLLAGKVAETTGINTAGQGNVGHPHNVEGHNELIGESFKQAEGEILLGFGDDTNTLNFGGGDKRINIRVPSGSTFVQTTHTVNGGPGLVKVNPQKLTKEHAEILYEALRTLYRKGKGFRGKMDDTRVEGLTAGEVVRLLAFTGERQTSPDHVGNALPEWMRDKQMYVKKDETGTLMLYFGTHYMPLMSNQHKADMKKMFVEWATTNKNYPGYISDTQLGMVGTNVPWTKTFKLGETSHDGVGSYGQYLMKSGFVKTDVTEFVPGTVFEGPVVEFNDVGIGKTIEKSKTNSVLKGTVEAKVDEENKIPVSKSKDIANAPEGATIMVTQYGIDENGKKVKEGTLEIGKIIKWRDGKLVFQVKPAFKNTYKNIQNKYTSDPDFLEAFTKEVGVLNADDISINVSGTEYQQNDTKEEPVKEKPLTEAAIEKQRAKELNSGDRSFVELSKERKERYPQVSTDLEFTEYNKEIKKAINAKYDALLKSIKKDVPPKDIGDMEEDDYESAFRIADKPAVEVHNLNKEMRVLRRRLGKRLTGDIKTVDKVIELASSGKKAWATYQHDAIIIYNAAETGTAYHEAFHRVSLGYLTTEERSRIYEAARQQYGLRGISEREVDEFLAEKFRDFMLQKQESRTLPQQVKDFFLRLWNHIKAVFTGPNHLTSYETDKLFDDIYYGKFRRNSILKDNLNNLKGQEYTREIYGTEFNTLDTITQIRGVVKSLTYALIGLNKRAGNIVDINDVSSVDFNLLLQDRINKLESYKTRLLNSEDLSEDQKNMYQARIDLWTDVLGYDEATDRYEAWDVMTSLMTQFLDNMGISLKKQKDVNPDEYQDDNGTPGIGVFDKASYETSVKDNALGAVKLEVALIPNGKKNTLTGMNEFVDYQEAWDTLLGDLYHMDNISEMIDRLEHLSAEEGRAWYKTLVARLKRNTGGMFQNQFEVTMRKHRTSFMNALSKFGTTVEFNFSDADVRSVSKTKVSEWNIQFYTSDKVNKEAGKEPVIDDSFNETLNETYNDLAADVRRDFGTPAMEDKTAEYYRRSIALLADVNVAIDDKTIDYILSSSEQSNEERLAEFIITDLKRIVINVISKHNPDNVHASKMFINDTAVKQLGDAYASAHPELISNMVLGPGSASYYTYTNYSSVTGKVRDFRNKPQLAADLLQKRGHTNSKFLDQIANDENVQQSLAVKTFAGIFATNRRDEGRDYMDMSSEEDYVLKMHAVLRGLVAFPTLADKKTYYFLAGLRTLVPKFDIVEGQSPRLSDETIDAIYKHAETEYDRITKAREERDHVLRLRASGKHKEAKEYMDKNMIAQYHYGPKGDLKTGNAYNFSHFKGLLDYDTFDETAAKEAIRDNINRLITRELDYASRMGIIFKDENGEWFSDRIDTKLMNDKAEEFGSDHLGIIGLFADFVIRTMDNNIELHKTFIGDPAMYKNDTDIGKRLGAQIAGGEEMVISTPKWGAHLTETNFNVSTLATQKLRSAYYNNLMKIFKMKVGEVKAKQILKPYLEMEQADGQAFISPEMYRSISIRIGEWNQKKEDAYNLLVSDKDLTLEEERDMLHTVMNPLKTVYFGLDVANDLAVPIYDKMSMAPLFRRALKVPGQPGKYLQMVKLLDRMEDPNSPIHMVKMDTVSKVGTRGAFGLFKDKGQTTLNNLNTIPVFQQQYKNLRRQQVTPVHDQNTRAVGTQFIKVAMANLNMTRAAYNGMTGKEIARRLNESLGALSKDGQERVDAKFGYKDGKIDKERTMELMRKEAIKAGMPMSVIDSLKLNSAGEFYLEPDAMPGRKWFQSRLIASVTKDVIDREMAGGQYIQVSNLGFRNDEVGYEYNYETATEDDRIKWLQDAKDIPFITMKNGKVIPMGCVVTVSMFKHVIPGYNKKTFAEKVAYIQDQELDILGYRIPTQGQNSTMAMRVVGILPEQYGDAIILPSEFTALTGSDFDIDKLFVVRKNYDYDTDGNLKETEYITDDDQKAFNKMVLYKYGVHKKYMSDEFKKWYRETNKDIIETSKRIRTEFADIDAKLDKLTDRINSLKEKIIATTDVAERIELNDKLGNLYEELDELKGDKGAIYDLSSISRTDRKELFKRMQVELMDMGVLVPFEEFQEQTDLEKNVPRAIENRLLNDYIAILTSEEHILRTAAPLGGLKTKLQGFADKMNQFTTRDDNVPMASLTPRYQSELKTKYSSGKTGIGPFALHNAHHVLTQQTGYKIAGYVSPLQKTTKVESKLVKGQKVIASDLSIIKGKDGVEITDWFSALIDAHVDMATDPYIMDLNINPFTYDMISYLLRTGVGEQAFKYIAQPGIRLASNIFMNNRRSIFRRKGYGFNDAVGEAIERLAVSAGIEEELDQYDEIIEKYGKEFLDNKVSREDEIFENPGMKRTKEFYLKQIAVLTKLGNIKAKANILTTDVQSTQVDTGKYGSSLIGLEAFVNKIKRSDKNSKDGLTWNYEKMIPFDQRGLVADKTEDEVFTADYYRNGFVHMLDMFSELTMDSTPVFRQMLNTLLKLDGNENTTHEPTMNRVANELYSAIIARFVFADKNGFNMTADNVKWLISGKANIFHRFDKLKAEHTELFDENPFLSRLTTYFDPSSKVKNYFLLKDTDFKDSMEIDDVVYSWEELLSHENADIANFARHLYMYSFYTTGFNHKVYGFHALIPPSFNREMPNKDGEIISLDATIKGLLKAMGSDEWRQYMTPILDDILSHGYAAPFIPQDFSFEHITVDGKSFYHTDNVAPLTLGYTEGGELIASPYLELDDRLFQYVGYVNSKEDFRAVYREVNKRGNRSMGRHLHEYGLTGPVLAANKGKNVFKEFPENLEQKMFERFDAEFVRVTMEQIFFNNYSKQSNLTAKEINEETAPVETEASLSTPQRSIEIFVDGSDAKDDSGDMGYGAHIMYNDTPYMLSGRTNKEVKVLLDKFPGIEMSNPTMEMMGLAAALSKFKDTSEHIVIRQDYSGAINFGGLWNRSEGSLKRSPKPWKAKEEYIKYLVDRSVQHIEQIEANGGSVSIQWVKGHATPADVRNNPELYTDENTTKRLNDGNNMADQLASLQESIDTFGDLIDQAEPVTAPEKEEVKPDFNPTNVEEPKRVEFLNYIKDQLGEIKGYTEGWSSDFTKTMDKAHEWAGTKGMNVGSYLIHFEKGDIGVDFKIGTISGLPSGVSDIKAIVGIGKYLEAAMSTDEQSSEGLVDMSEMEEEGKKKNKECNE